MEKANLKPGECPNCHTRWLSMNQIDSDTEECPGCGCLILHALNIKVLKVPDGPAPLKIREAWVGLNLLARKTLLKGPEIDFTNNNLVSRGGAYKVPLEMALEILEKKSPEAAQWFRVNCPSWMDHLTFGVGEVEATEEFCVYDMPQISSN